MLNKLIFGIPLVFDSNSEFENVSFMFFFLGGVTNKRGKSKKASASNVLAGIHHVERN